MPGIRRSWLVLAGLVALCLLVGLIGGLAASQSVDWYPALTKPDWQPPPWALLPLWIALYILMAIAAWMVWKRDMRFAGVRLSLTLFFVQLALSLAWPLIFFGARSIGWALVDIAALSLALLLTVWAFFGQSKGAGLLMLPYLASVSFAAILNGAIYRLN